MEWLIKIDKISNIRIRVVYSPIDGQITFNGEYKLNNNKWVSFAHKSMDEHLTLLDIQEILYDIYKEVLKKSEKYNDLNNTFNAIKMVDILID